MFHANDILPWSLLLIKEYDPMYPELGLILSHQTDQLTCIKLGQHQDKK